MQNVTPAQIVNALDRYIIGPASAKRAIAVAIRNRWRRQHLAPDWHAMCYPEISS
jgi:ATP-dependent HslUV protease ATP-binding subunit HslU